MTIDYLQKELSDREILLASQNEKISQLDNQLKMNGVNHQHREITDFQRDLEESQKEIDRLLKIIQTLEKEKNILFAKLNEANPSISKTSDYEYGTLERQRDSLLDKNTENLALKRR